MPALTQSQVVSVTSAYIDPGVGAVHSHGSAEVLLSAIAGSYTGAGGSLGLTTRLFPMPNCYTWQTIIGGTGSLSALTVNLEGSLDGTNFFTLDQSTNTSGEGRHVTNKPIRYVRANIAVSTVSSGAPTVTVIFGE